MWRREQYRKLLRGKSACLKVNMFLSPDDIKIGKRYRSDVDIGINDLCRSIEALGQLQPVIVDSERESRQGQRRNPARCDFTVWK